MPFYTYKASDGSEHDWHGPSSKRPSTIPVKVDGVSTNADYDFAATQSSSGDTPPGNWPLKSEAAAINPKQIPEAIEFCRTHGVPTEFTRSGQPIFTSRDHRKRHLDARNMFDRQAGFGDPVP